MEKKDWIRFGKIFAMFIWAFISIATGAGAINYGYEVVKDGFYIVMGILSILGNGWAIYREAFKLKKNEQ